MKLRTEIDRFAEALVQRGVRLVPISEAPWLDPFFAILPGRLPRSYDTFVLICVSLAVRPARPAASILFWPFAAGASFYGWLLANDWWLSYTGWGAPEFHSDDLAALVMLEVTLIAVSVLLFVMSRARSG